MEIDPHEKTFIWDWYSWFCIHIFTNSLTLLVLKYSGRTGSISCLLMSWFRVLPGHCGPVMPHGNIYIWVNIGSDNGSFHDETKPLPEPMLTKHQCRPVAFTRGQFLRKCSTISSLDLSLKVNFRWQLYLPGNSLHKYKKPSLKVSTTWLKQYLVKSLRPVDAFIHLWIGKSLI